MSLRLATIGLLLALGGCGFQPLYGQPAVTGGMTRISVVAPDGRVGYLLRESLDDEFGRDKSIPAAWRLNMSIGEGRTALGLRPDATAQRYEYDMTVTYTLTEIATGKVAHRGAVTSAISYDSAVQPYAGIAAHQDTQDLLASDLARKIQLEVSAWLARQPG